MGLPWPCHLLPDNKYICGEWCEKDRKDSSALLNSISIHFSEIFDWPWKDTWQIGASHPIHIAHIDDPVVEVSALDLDYLADWNHSGHSFVQIGVLVSDGVQGCSIIILAYVYSKKAWIVLPCEFLASWMGGFFGAWTSCLASNRADFLYQPV